MDNFAFLYPYLLNFTFYCFCFGGQVQNFHSCIQVTEDFVSPEHLVQSFHLTQELRLLKEEINYDDKLQVRDEFSN